jgi:hypothetical protein
MHTRTKIITAVVALLIIGGVVAAFVFIPRREKSDREEIVYGMGTTLGNMLNGSAVVETEDWIYFLNYVWHGPYRMRHDDTERHRVREEWGAAFNFNLLGDWIYFWGGYPGDVASIIRMRIDGTQREQLSETPTGVKMIVVNEWIYYRTEEDFTLFRMQTDGSSHEMLSNETIGFFNVMDDYIFYSVRTEDGGFYRMRIDGSENTQLSDSVIGHFIIEGEWIYYKPGLFSYYGEGQIYRMRLDGTENELIIEDNVRMFNILDNWIFYSNADDEWQLYRIGIDGTGRELFLDVPIGLINVTSEWIYYSNVPMSPRLHRIRPNGTENTSLNN